MLENITNAIDTTKSFFTDSVEIFNMLFEIFPSPIDNILRGALILILAYIAYRLIRG